LEAEGTWLFDKENKLILEVLVWEEEKLVI
jgi:hypothetical protein